MATTFNNIWNNIKQRNTLSKLIIINVTVFLVLAILKVFSKLFGLGFLDTNSYIAVSSNIEFVVKHIWTLFTYMFVHYEFFHILFNMLMLYWFGQIFTLYFTTKHLVAVYILGGLAGALFYILTFNTIPYFVSLGYSEMVGASASVTAIIFAAAFYNRNMEVRMLFIGQIKIIYIALFIFVLDFIALGGNSNQGGHIAHIGGAILGYFFAVQYIKGRDITKWFNKLVDKCVNLFTKRPQMKVKYKKPESDFNYNQRKHNEAEEIDMILDKIKQSGYKSLTEKEKNDYLMQVTNKNNTGFFKKILKSLFGGLNIIALILLFSFFFTWNISPAKTIYWAYIGLAAPFIITANLFFIIFWTVIKSWKLALINLLCVLVCYNPILTYSPLNFITSSETDESFKVLSYNVRGFNWKFDEAWEKNPIITYVQSTDADIVCFQEYLASTNNNFSSSKKLQKTLKNYPYYRVTALRSTQGGYEYGLACFSKYPIIEVEQIPIKSSDNGSVLYKINIKGKIVTLINNHLESNRLTLADKKLYKAFFKERNSKILDDVAHNIDDRLGKAYKIRGPQADLISQYIKEQNTDGIIVCGDFNDTPISYVYHKVKEDLVDSYTENGFGPGITYHENYFWFRIDYIMHSKNMNAFKFHVDKVKYSDHYPVWTYLNFKK